MIALGAVLILVALLTNVPVLETIGLIILLTGAVLFLLGSMGRAVGGRRHYW